MKMKTLYSKLATFVLLAAWVFALSACKDDTPVPGGTGSDVPTQIEMRRINSFYKIDVPLTGSWTVTEYPEWAGPMNDNGNEGEQIVLFADTNDEEEDRSGTLTVVGSDGTVLQFTLFQHGLISDEDNGAILTEDDLMMSYGVGYTVNVFGLPDQTKYNMMASTPIKMNKMFKMLKTINEPDAVRDEDRYYSRVESVTGNSTSAVANQLSINAGIEVGFSAFKVAVDAGYAKNNTGNEKYTYAMEEIQHIVGSRELRPNALRYMAQQGMDIFQTTFKRYIDALKANPNDETTMRRLLNQYGTHVITQGTLGGELKLSMQLKETDKISSSDIHAALELGVSVINVGGDFNMNSEEKAIASNTSISLSTYGGNNVYSLAPGTTFAEFQNQVKDKKKLDGWVSTIQNKTSLALIDMETIPIYDLLPTEASRNALRKFMTGKYQDEIYANDTTYHGPDLYVLQNFYQKINEERESSLTIPEIDVEVVARRMLMPELSDTEYSTVIYSGNIGKVDYTRGFFVGSPTRKPCKFHTDRNGRFVTEEFETLSTGALTELYVDATGNITIFPAGLTEFYRTVEFEWEPFVLNLDEVKTSPYTLEYDAIIMKSNASLKLILDNGVTAWLSDASFQSIACNGNNNIILADHTENTIKQTSNAAGIDIQTGQTLTISGNGTLSITSPLGPGIGTSTNNSKGGNLIITGGNIDVRSSAGAAIGTGTNGLFTYNFGDITITGGEITAVSTAINHAAIGSGPNATCGNIKITDGVTKVTVSKGIKALSAIGQGDSSGTCGTVQLLTDKVSEL